MISVAPPVGRYAPDFELPDSDGTVHHLFRYLETWQAVVVVMLSSQCPGIETCVRELNALQTEFSPQGITVVGISANDDKQVPEDSYDRMKAFADAYHLQFPYLRDVTQDVARTFGAESIPQAFLVDADWKVRYAGAVCSLPHESDTVIPYLREAIAQLLAGEPITVPSTPTTGCPIKWRSSIG